MKTVAVDSGSEIHVLPISEVASVFEKVGGYQLMMKGAGGERLEHYGQVRVDLEIGRETFKIVFEVAKVRRGLLSVASMVDAGYDVQFGRRPGATQGGMFLPFERQGGLYTLRGVPRGVRALLEPGPRTVRVMPTEEIVDELPGGGADGEVSWLCVPQH